MWRVTIRSFIVNIISYGEGGAHSTTQYTAMAEIKFRSNQKI